MPWLFGLNFLFYILFMTLKTSVNQSVEDMMHVKQVAELVSLM